LWTSSVIYSFDIVIVFIVRDVVVVVFIIVVVVVVGIVVVVVVVGIVGGIALFLRFAAPAIAIGTNIHATAVFIVFIFFIIVVVVVVVVVGIVGGGIVDGVGIALFLRFAAPATAIGTLIHAIVDVAFSLL
jgi:hypothetical protein